MYDYATMLNGHFCKFTISLVDITFIGKSDFKAFIDWTRKLKELLENNLGWEFQLNNAVDGIYFAEDDE
ncbi:hypothetical protein CFP56_003801, partial [Quercus suber]